ncbi:V-type proton ATPase subunit e 1 isoform X2 [Columba livia]|uniref:V-type proton ATPase subunit e 1 isoform X2 n=1 Tax=Columba livia TaxID=8932 RepID=UPI0031BA1F4C
MSSEPALDPTEAAPSPQSCCSPFSSVAPGRLTRRSSRRAREAELGGGVVERGGAKSGGGAKRSRPGALRAQATWRALIGGRGSGAGRCGRLRAAGGAAPGRAASLCRPRHGVRWPDGAHHRHERFLGTGRRRPAVAHTQGAQPREIMTTKSLFLPLTSPLLHSVINTMLVTCAVCCYLL